jgi:hypothetical protein
MTNSEEIEALKLRVKELESRLAALESVLKVTAGPTLTVTAPVITIAATTKMSIDGGPTLNIESDGLMALKSGLITLN